jgi:hypothetical protein
MCTAQANPQQPQSRYPADIRVILQAGEIVYLGPQGVSLHLESSGYCLTRIRSSMDPCIHPELTQITGFLAGYGKGPRPQTDLYPILAMCSTPLHSDVLTVS